MFGRFFIFILLLIFGKINSYRNGTEPRQIDIIFSFVRGPNFPPGYLNTTLFPFVKNIVNQFYFPDEVEPGNKKFIRIGFASSWNGNVEGDASVDYICFDDRTSFDLDQIMNGYFTNISNENNSIIAALTSAEFCLRSDYCHTNKTSITTNRVLVLLTDIATLNGSNFNTKLDLDEVLPKFTYIFGVGLNGTLGNQVATNKQDFIKIIGYSNRVFSTIDEANDPTTGLVSQIYQLISPNPNCSGVIFMAQFGNFTNQFKDIYYPALINLVPMLNSTKKGFTHETVFTNEYIFFSAQKILDYLNFAAVEGQSGSFENLGNIGFLHSKNNNKINNPRFAHCVVTKLEQFLFFKLFTYAFSSYYFEKLLVYFKSGYYQNYAVIYIGQTDYEPNLTKSKQLALKIASFNYPVYVIDISVNPIDNQELFKILTNNVDEKILKLGNNLSANDLYDYLESTFLVDVDLLGCDVVPTISPIPLTTVMATTTDQSNVTKRTTVGRFSTSGVSQVSISTVNPTTFPPTQCSGIIFMGEFTRFISNSSKENFIKLAANLSAQIPNSLQFAFAEYGKIVYRPIVLQPYQTFKNDLTIIWDDFLENYKPDGSLNYLQYPLSNLKNTLIENTPSKFVVLMMGETLNVRDPSSSNTLARSIASLGTNVYVLDFTQGNLPFSLWSTLTSDKPDHVVNGTGLSFDQLTTSFAAIITDVLNNNC